MMAGSTSGIARMDPTAFAAFDRLSSEIAARGEGLTLVQLRDLHRLAVALGEDPPDRRTVKDLCRRLRLDVERVCPRERYP